MADTNLKKFKIDLSAPVSDDLSAEAPMIERRKGVDTTRRPMVVLLICIVIIGLVFVWGYHDLRKILHAVDATGSTEISVLSGQIDEAFEELKAQMADRDTAVQAEMSRMAAQLKTVESALGDVQTQKADKSELKTATGQILAVVEAVKKDIEEIRHQIDQLGLQTETALGSIEKVRFDIEKIFQLIEKLSVTGVDKDMLDAALTAEREFIQQNMAHASETIFSQIASLKQALSELRLQVDKLSRSIPTTAPGKPEIAPKSIEGIIEQEIK